MRHPVIRPEIGSSLRAGDLVRIRSEAEILASLDPAGRLDGLPCMPEMLRHCGETHRVYRRADKTCDSIYSPGLRAMTATVLLAGLRCDGSEHGGCQARCLFFWRERWLEPADRAAPASLPVAADPPPGGPTRDDLARACVRASTTPGAPRYVCQATELAGASRPFRPRPAWDPRRYAADLRTGNVTLGRMAAGIIWRVATDLELRARVVVRRLARRVGRGRAPAGGAVRHVPAGAPLQPGDRVRIRRLGDIRATLDDRSRNRGLVFTREMRAYCGREAEVLARAERIINERTGEMTLLHDDVILKDVVCRGEYHDFCPRAVYPFWRDAWLERAAVAEPVRHRSTTDGTEADRQSDANRAAARAE